MTSSQLSIRWSGKVSLRKRSICLGPMGKEVPELVRAGKEDFQAEEAINAKAGMVTFEGSKEAQHVWRV